MDKELKAKWVAALRSGEYQQTEGALHNDEGFCCLGVLCEVAQFPEWDGSCVTINETKNRENLPKTLCERVDLPWTYGGAGTPGDGILMEMNDEGKTFSEIADYIEANL